MHSFIEGQLGMYLNWTMYSIFKLDDNEIGDYGVRQLAKCRWHNLSKIDLGNMRIIKTIIILETLAASG